MQNDERCCGSGTCIIDADGLCWCGQRWQGNQLCADAAAQDADNQDALSAPLDATNPA